MDASGKPMSSLRRSGVASTSPLSDNLIPGSTAGSQMAHTFSLMGGRSGVGQKAFAAIGLHATDLNYTMRNKGLIPAFQQLKDRLAAPQDGRAMGGGAGGLAAEKAQLSKFGFTPAQVNQIVTKGADKTVPGHRGHVRGPHTGVHRTDDR